MDAQSQKRRSLKEQEVRNGTTVLFYLHCFRFAFEVRGGIEHFGTCVCDVTETKTLGFGFGLFVEKVHLYAYDYAHGASSSKKLDGTSIFLFRNKASDTMHMHRNRIAFSHSQQATRRSGASSIRSLQEAAQEDGTYAISGRT